jgi:formate hydrogenlyase subunit 3/multisubunit Na+/H+ antiporter MnhD subunit
MNALTGENDLDRLGGLSQRMPVTFGVAGYFALSISGVPPFNGFASKWMIYQGIIDFGSGHALASTCGYYGWQWQSLGSALTLASFIKFISGAFLGNLPGRLNDIKEAGAEKLLPLTVLALLCTVLGVFATSYFVPRNFFPVTGSFEFYGVWQSAAVSALILFSILLGVPLFTWRQFRVNSEGPKALSGEKRCRPTGVFRLQVSMRQSAMHRYSHLYMRKGI